MTSVPGVTSKRLKRPPIPDPFKPGSVWVVPQGEEFRFARYRGRPVTSQPTQASPEATWVPAGGVLMRETWRSVAGGWRLMGFDREIVVSRMDVGDAWLLDFGFRATQLGDDRTYIKALAIMLGVDAEWVTDARVQKWVEVRDAFGWDGVYSEIHHKVLGTDKDRVVRGTDFWQFLRQVAASPSDVVFRSLWPLMATYGEDEVYHAVLSFLDRAITWYSDGRAKVSRFYQELLGQFCARHDATRVFRVVSILHASNLPPVLRLVDALRVLDNARQEIRLPAEAAAPPVVPNMANVEVAAADEMSVNSFLEKPVEPL